jgi:galactonate dehydratase
MVDVHGPPWLTPRDAIALGKQLEPYNLLFYEDPIAPENYKALAKVAANVSLPIAAGERHAGTKTHVFCAIM